MSDEEILVWMAEALESQERPFLTTGEVAEGLIIESDGTRERLKELSETESVGGYKAGSVWLWWITAYGLENLDAGELASEAGEEGADDGGK